MLTRLRRRPKLCLVARAGAGISPAAGWGLRLLNVRADPAAVFGCGSAAESDLAALSTTMSLKNPPATSGANDPWYVAARRVFATAMLLADQRGDSLKPELQPDIHAGVGSAPMEASRASRRRDRYSLSGLST